MDKGDKFFFLKYYFYGRRYVCLFFVLLFSLLVLLGFLFDTYRSFIGYLSLLLGFFAAFIFLFDFLLEYQNFRREALYAEGKAQTALEALLFEKVEKLEVEKKEQMALGQEKFNDLLDYYTLWAHQIKTPIAASSLLVQDLKDDTPKKQLEQELFKIESYANLVLQYLRLESFHEDLLLAKENLEDLVKEVVKKYALFFIQQGLSLNLRNLEQTIVTDKKWFVIILEQVLSNSLKYTQEGGIEIYFENNTLYLKDTGLGIRQSDLERVFERGFSGYNGRLTHQSSGLGLYLSKKIADQLGHSLTLESKVGRGTTVKIGLKERKLLID